MKEITLTMRKSVTLKIGDKLVFSPGIEALAGEDCDFFKKYAGMEAAILGFEEDDWRQTFADAILGQHGEPKEGDYIAEADYRFFVKFENGDKPPTSLGSFHFTAL